MHHSWVGLIHSYVGFIRSSIAEVIANVQSSRSRLAQNFSIKLSWRLAQGDRTTHAVSMHVELHRTRESDVNILRKQLLIEICAAHVATEHVVCSSNWPEEQQCSGESQVANDGPGSTGDTEG